MTIVVAAAGTALAQSAPPSSSPGPTPGLSLAPGEIALHGAVVGHADNLVTEAWDSRTVVDMSLDLVLILSASRGRADGTFSIAGETTLDCEHADSGIGEVHWDSNTSEPFAADGEPWARVSLSMADPRYVIPDLETFVFNVGAGIRRWGGTCGHTNGPVFEASPQFSVAFPSCPTIEVHRIDPSTWQGSCTGLSKGESTVTARFEALPGD